MDSISNTTAFPHTVMQGESDGVPPELSVVLPCLDEAETIGQCIQQIRHTLELHHIGGEIIVADNGSTDRSAVIARDLGVRVVPAPVRGYGSAILAGLHSARGKYLLIGDADGSYDFSHIPRFLNKLREGYDLVNGDRFAGYMEVEAMSFLHRFIGNPILTYIGRLFFHSSVHDFHCGLRALTRDAFHRLGLRTRGMEFASEMIVKATLLGLSIAEVPTTLSRDGRTIHPSHLRTWRDGWRHLRFLVLFAPQWLLLYPGAALLLIGLTITIGALSLPPSLLTIALRMGIVFAAVLVMMVGCEAIVFALMGYSSFPLKYQSHWRLYRKLHHRLTFEIGLLSGGALLIVGVLLSVYSLVVLREPLPTEAFLLQELRVALPAAIFVFAGVQILLSSALVSLLRTVRK